LIHFYKRVKMVEDELRELLLDYKNMAESEHSAFVSVL